MKKQSKFFFSDFWTRITSEVGELEVSDNPHCTPLLPRIVAAGKFEALTEQFFAKFNEFA